MRVSESLRLLRRKRITLGNAQNVRLAGASAGHAVQLRDSALLGFLTGAAPSGCPNCSDPSDNPRVCFACYSIHNASNSRRQLIEPLGIQPGNVGASAFYQIDRILAAQAQHLFSGQAGVGEHAALPGNVGETLG